MKVHAGIIGSSGGSALKAAAQCAEQAGIELDLTVIVDRECGMREWAEAAGHRTLLVPYTSNHAFSSDAARIFLNDGCQDVLLYYTRLVGTPLIDKCRVQNIHPSLLPAFPGLHGVRDAVAARGRVLGATLHEVDAGIDTGPIAAQVACAIDEHITLDRANRLSYLQKVYLTLVWFESLQNSFVNGVPVNEQRGVGITTSSAGILNPELLKAYRAWASDLEGSSAIAGSIAA